MCHWALWRPTFGARHENWRKEYMQKAEAEFGTVLPIVYVLRKNTKLDHFRSTECNTLVDQLTAIPPRQEVATDHFNHGSPCTLTLRKWSGMLAPAPNNFCVKGKILYYLVSSTFPGKQTMYGDNQSSVLRPIFNLAESSVDHFDRYKVVTR